MEKMQGVGKEEKRKNEKKEKKEENFIIKF